MNSIIFMPRYQFQHIARLIFIGTPSWDIIQKSDFGSVSEGEFLFVLNKLRGKGFCV